jgi:N-acetylglucosamine-6-phosphate deacetylase
MRTHDAEPRPAGGRLVLRGARVVTPAATRWPGWVELRGGEIAAVGDGRPALGDGMTALDLGGAWLVPGFVDLHVHGGGGAWLSSTDPAEIAEAAGFHLRHGTTAMLASIATAPLDRMLASAAAVSAMAAATLAADGPTAGPAGPMLAGIHLEGPFISPERAGAQDPDGIREPDRGTLLRLLEACGGWARTVTVAPEREGGLELVRSIAEAGVVPAIGHTQAGYERAGAAIDAGVRVSTHLFNAMPGLHHRHLGTVGAALSRDEVVCELVNDGVHLRREVVSLVFHAAGGRVALVTDAIAAAGMADGDYDFGRVPLRVRGGVARLAGAQTIAGSTLTMDAALRRAVADVGVPIGEAVAAASTTPARVIGIAGRTGSIEPGKAADLVVLDADLEVAGVMAGGVWVREPAPASAFTGAASA